MAAEKKINETCYGKFIAELPQGNAHGEMPQRHQSYGHPANVVVGGWKNICRREQVPDCDDPVRGNNE